MQFSIGSPIISSSVRSPIDRNQQPFCHCSRLRSVKRLSTSARTPSRRIHIVSFLKSSSTKTKPVHLTLQKDQLRNIKRGHPWLFAEALLSLPESPPGSLAILKTKKGEIIAKGIYDRTSRIAFRVCTVNERLDDKLVEARLEAAWKLRQAVIDPATTSGYRLLNGEGDLLPGLVCDVYGQIAVVKLDGAGPMGFYDVQKVAEWLVKKVQAQSVYLKYRAGEGEDRGRILVGEVPLVPMPFVEHGVRFEADVVQGQKTGFFLDQRDNRRLLMSFCRNARVLNMFGYTGGFSVYAGKGGAKHVTTVDIAKPALAMADRNWALNSLPAAAHEGVAEDAFQYLAQAKREQRQWDVVVVDPPSFAPNKAALEAAIESYTRLFALAANVTSTGGTLALSSCSSHVTAPAFLNVCYQALYKAKRSGTVLGVHAQPADHPWPLACEEMRYLKFVLLRLND